MTVRCKFLCMAIDDIAGSTSKRVTLGAFYSPEVPEDVRFTKWTPTGTLGVTIDNPRALAALAPGKYYYLDLSPVEPEVTAEPV